MKTLTEKVSRLRLEAYLGQIVLKVGLESLVMSPAARIQLLKHLAGQRVTLFLMGLPPTLQCQNCNHLLANYGGGRVNTVARIKLESFPLKESDGLRITDIKFAAPETEEDFNK